MTYGLYDDLHTEFEDRDKIWTPPVVPGRDTLFFAGDIASSPRDLNNFARKVEYEQPEEVKNIVYIAGNHEFYGKKSRFGYHGYEEYREALRGLKRSIFLEQETLELHNGWTVIGATLWTDLSNPVAEANARSHMNDYQKIQRDAEPYGKICPNDTTKWHRRSTKFIKQALQESDPKRTVLLTHHSPVQYGLTTHHAENDIILLDMYGARLENILTEFQPTLALHGHTHKTCIRNIGDTLIMNNPRGYVIKNNVSQEKYPEKWEQEEIFRNKLINAEFDPYFSQSIRKEYQLSR